jgi:hypothetical protein
VPPGAHATRIGCRATSITSGASVRGGAGIPGIWKILVGGYLCGVAGVLVFHQGLTTLMFYHFELLQAVFGLPEALRPVAPGYVLALAPPIGAPRILYVCFYGGLWGLLLVGLLRTGLPELATGFLLGAVVCTFVGFQLEVGVRGMPFWSGGYLPVWMSVALANGAWGWGTAGLMRAAGIVGERQ